MKRARINHLMNSYDDMDDLEEPLGCLQPVVAALLLCCFATILFVLCSCQTTRPGSIEFRRLVDGKIILTVQMPPTTQISAGNLSLTPLAP